LPLISATFNNVKLPVGVTPKVRRSSSPLVVIRAPAPSTVTESFSMTNPVGPKYDLASSVVSVIVEPAVASSKRIVSGYASPAASRTAWRSVPAPELAAPRTVHTAVDGSKRT